MLVKLLASLVTLGVTAVGLLAFASGYAPERWTRFGYASALSGADARQFGASIILLGLLPLLLWAKTPKAIVWWGTAGGVLLLINIFFGARVWG